MRLTKMEGREGFLASPFFEDSDRLELLRDQTIFVTGISGWFGKWFLEAFYYLNEVEKFNIRIIGVTRSKKRFLESFSKASSFKWLNVIESDLRELKLERFNFTYLIHAAGSVPQSQSALLNNSWQELFVSQLMSQADQKLKSVLYLSSGAVYDSKSFPPEGYSEYSTLLPAGDESYGGIKLSEEKLLINALSQSNSTLKIARCFTFVGPLVHPNAEYAFNSFIKDISGGTNLRVFSPGSKRSFMHMGDAVFILLALLVDARKLEVMNIGGLPPLTMAEAARILGEKYNLLTEQSSHQPDSMYYPDVSKMISFLGARKLLESSSALLLSAESILNKK